MSSELLRLYDSAFEFSQIAYEEICMYSVENKQPFNISLSDVGCDTGNEFSIILSCHTGNCTDTFITMCENQISRYDGICEMHGKEYEVVFAASLFSIDNTFLKCKIDCLTTLLQKITDLLAEAYGEHDVVEKNSRALYV